MSSQEAAPVFDIRQCGSEFVSAMEVPEPAFDGSKFSLEVPSSMDQRLFINDFQRGLLCYGRSIGIDLSRRLPGHRAYHFFRDPEQMYRNLEVLGIDVLGIEEGFYVGEGMGLAIANNADKRMERSVLGHETIHAFHELSWVLAGSRTLTESLVDLAATHVMRDWCRPSRATDCMPNYSALGLVTDEIVRKAAIVLNIAPRRIFAGLMTDLLTGRKRQVSEHIMRRVLGREALEYLVHDTSNYEYIDDVFDLADKLGLPDVYRRWAEVSSRPIGHLILSKWITREDIPEAAPPLSEAERRDMQGDQEETGPTRKGESFEIPEEIVYRPPLPASSQASSTLMEIRDTLQATANELVDVKEKHLDHARYMVDGIISNLHTIRTECHTLMLESEAKLRELERKLQDVTAVDDMQPAVNPQTQYDSLKAHIAKLRALAATMDNAIDAAAADRERLEYGSALVSTAVEMTMAYESRL